MTKPPVQVNLSKRFLKALKSLRKRYPSAPHQAQSLIDILEQGEIPGDQMQGTGFTVYKVRLPNPDAGRGKSGGYRVIYYLYTPENIYLLIMYSKSDRVDVSVEFVRRLIEEAGIPLDGEES